MKTRGKAMLAICGIAMMVALAGCVQQAASSPSGSAAGSSQTSLSSSAASSAAASMANPWSSAATAEEAAKGAGLEAFTLPEGAIADLGEPFEVTYRYMDGMAEARFEFPASAVTARTSLADKAENADISGDYNAYAHEWVQEVAGISVACAGNREGESTKTYWAADGQYHSLVAEGLGGDADFGLDAERLAVFVQAMR